MGGWGGTGGQPEGVSLGEPALPLIFCAVESQEKAPLSSLLSSQPAAGKSNWSCWGQESCPCPSSAAGLKRADPTPHLEGTGELTLVVGTQVSWLKGVSRGELGLQLVCCP